MQKLLNNETLLFSSDDKTVSLTTYRIREVRKEKLISIMLENISSVQVKYKDYPIMLLGILVGIAIALLSNVDHSNPTLAAA